MSVVLDANCVVALAIPLPYSSQVSHRMAGWCKAGVELLAPTLLEYEVVTALRKAVLIGMLSADQASDAVGDLLNLGIHIVAPTRSLHAEALRWSQRLSHRVAYDAQYLALAEQLGAAFWTADQRLVNGAQQAGATWVHWIGEPDV